jgi:hypothetical protein
LVISSIDAEFSHATDAVEHDSYDGESSGIYLNFFKKKSCIDILLDDGFDYDEGRDIAVDDENVAIFENTNEDFAAPNKTWLDQVISMLQDTENYGNKFVFRKGMRNFFIVVINLALFITDNLFY